VRGHRDLTAMTGAAFLCALVALIVPVEVVRLAFAAPLCLVLPGYAITAAVFAPSPLERPQAMLFTFGLSLTTLATGVLILHFMPGGVRDVSWAALLCAVVVAGGAIAARRRPRRSRASLPTPRLRLRPLDGVLLAGAALSVVAALVLSWTTLPAENAVGYTQLWMLPAEGPASGGVRIGVANVEPDRLRYRLEVRQEGGEEPFISRFALDPGQEATRFVGVSTPQAGEVRVTARLYRWDRPAVVYRRVSAWVPGA
jgi:uncharacterized membrane protein